MIAQALKVNLPCCVLLPVENCQLKHAHALIANQMENLENLPETLIMAEGPFANLGWHRGPSLCLQVRQTDQVWYPPG